MLLRSSKRKWKCCQTCSSRRLTMSKCPFCGISVTPVIHRCKIEEYRFNVWFKHLSSLFQCPNVLNQFLIGDNLLWSTTRDFIFSPFFSMMARRSACHISRQPAHIIKPIQIRAFADCFMERPSPASLGGESGSLPSIERFVFCFRG